MFVLAAAGIVCGDVRVTETWYWCLTRSHERDPAPAAATRSVWAVMVVALLVFGAVFSFLPRGRWCLLPVLFAVAAVLTWLYVVGMGSPAPLRPGDPGEGACWTVPVFPFLG
ncbi:hypothetical protein ACFYS8_17440 [Kitasatospora sp. NPDC004615]|uniref:hypothetical protein n=1 Tax=Kitasatospora sp. NPDC004615 TaxID=3364017 RepID=UPI0036797631